MAAANPKHFDFISRVRQNAQALKSALIQTAALQQEYVLLGYASGAADPITQDDCVGGNADVTPMDLATYIGGLAPVQSVLAADNNSLQAGLLKMGR